MYRLAVICIVIGTICIDLMVQGFHPIAPISVRNKRKTLGIDLSIDECAQLGSTCTVRRDNEKPSAVFIRPCCKHLHCAGDDPYELVNGLRQAHHVDKDHITGICSLGLDDDEATEVKDEYIKYVQGLP